MKVRELMSKDVVSLSPEDTVVSAVESFTKHRVSGCPVIDANGKLVGILSETDILKALIMTSKTLRLIYPSLSMVSVAFVEDEQRKEILKAFKDISASKVQKVMKTEVVTIDAESPVEDAIVKMKAMDINRIPVISKGKVVGIITRHDIIKGLGNE